jgi:hypothetical protein
MDPLSFQQVIDGVRLVPNDHVVYGRGSVFDVIRLGSTTKKSTISKVWKQLTDAIPTWKQLPVHQFPGSGQRPTPIADIRTLVKIVWVIPGKTESFKDECITLLLRHFVEDEALHAEIRRNRTRMIEEVLAPTNDLQDAILVNQVVANEQTAIPAIEPTPEEQTVAIIEPTPEEQRVAIIEPTPEEQRAIVTARTNVQLNRHAAEVIRHVVDRARSELELLDMFRASAPPDLKVLLEVAFMNAGRRAVAMVGGASDIASAEKLPERVSVQMCFNDLLQRGVVHSKGTKALGDVGKTVAQRFKAIPGNGQVDRQDESTLVLKRGAEAEIVIETVDVEVAKTCRIRHGVVYGLSEIHKSATYNVWTYPSTFKTKIEQIMMNNPMMRRTAKLVFPAIMDGNV